MVLEISTSPFVDIQFCLTTFDVATSSKYRFFDRAVDSNVMISRKIDREHHVFSLEMSQGGIEALLERYRGIPFTRVSICVFEMNLKSFLPPFVKCGFLF